MNQPTYTLRWILPFVRQALSRTGNIEFRVYVDNLWRHLEDAHVPGVARTPSDRMFSGQVYQYEQAPYDLRAVTTEAFYYLIRQGYLAPEPPDGYMNPPTAYKYRVTERGKQWFGGSEPYPEETVGYLKFMHQLVPSMDPVIEQYVVESLTAFERQAYFAATVMLGAASEKAIYLLAETMLGAIKDINKRNKLQSTLDARSLLKLLTMVKDTIEYAHKTKTLPYAQFEGSDTHLMSMFEAIRVQRNDAVHPMNATVSADSTRLLIQSFPYALCKSEELRAWFSTNLNSI